VRAHSALFVLRKFRSLRRHPGTTADEVRRFRDEQLRHVIAHAYRAVPHYRRLFVQHGVSPEDVDCFRLPDGRVVHPYAVFVPMRTRAPWIRHFQVTQTRADHIVMRAVASPPPSAGDLALVRGMMETAFGPRVQVALELVAELPFEPSGKLRTYRSLVWEADAPRADRAPGEL